MLHDLVDWNSGVSVRTSTKSFSDFHLIWYRMWVDLDHMCTSVTLTRSKVKVMQLLELQNVHFSRSISSAVFARSSKLMVGSHSMGTDLQLIGARFSNFLLGKLSRELKLRRMSLFHENQMAIFRNCVMLQSHGWASW